VTTETLVDLLRHGETAGGDRLRGGRCDDELTERGRRQLEHAIGSDPCWQVVAASPLVRCRGFAEALGSRPGCELVIDERLREYDFGDWDGRPFDELWRDHGDALAAFFGDPDVVVPPGGESADVFRERVRAAWRDLLDAHAGGRVLVIGHGGVLRQVVADVLGADGPVHAALEWPHAAMSRVRVIEDPVHGRTQALVWHGRTFV